MMKKLMTYYTTDDGRPEGLMDRLANILWKLKTYKIHGSWPIIKDKTGEVCGGIYYIEGPKYIVKFLSWATNSPFTINGKEYVFVNVNEDNNQIIEVKEYKGV